MIIDGVEYVKADEANIADSHLRIVVLDRGFVVVGNVRTDGSYLIIDNCQCVRCWGTTAGLGQLASDGPRKGTTLDPQPRTRVHELQVVQQIDCEVTAWNL